MSGLSFGTRLRGITTDAIDTAAGRQHRPDEVSPGSGGPAGNATLTAWTGLILLVLFLAEGVTVLDVHGLITWHLVIGVLLVPPALLKTATTGWRIVRYYLGDRAYRQAGPPPTLLRLLGPLVILSTLAVLGSGVALVVVGPTNSREVLATLAGHRIDAITIHQASFLIWAAATGLHILGRLVPALRLTVLRASERHVPGPWRRGAVLVVTGVAAALAAVLVLQGAGAWQHEPRFHNGRGPGTHASR
jgi:hypothetical protein